MSDSPRYNRPLVSGGVGTVGTGEERPAVAHLGEDAAQAPHVQPRRVRAVSQHQLGAAVPPTTASLDRDTRRGTKAAPECDDLRCVGDEALAELPAEAKVRQLQLPTRPGEEQVLWLLQLGAFRRLTMEGEWAELTRSRWNIWWEWR